MSLQMLVLVDTCIWVPFFNRPHSPLKGVLDALLDENRATLVGPIVMEVLCGFRQDSEADWVASLLRGLQYLELEWEDWRSAAALGRQLVARGHRLPMSDLAVAAVALRHDCAVFTTDPHFDLIPKLKRFHV